MKWHWTTKENDEQSNTKSKNQLLQVVIELDFFTPPYSRKPACPPPAIQKSCLEVDSKRRLLRNIASSWQWSQTCRFWFSLLGKSLSADGVFFGDTTNLTTWVFAKHVDGGVKKARFIVPASTARHGKNSVQPPAIIHCERWCYASFFFCRMRLANAVIIQSFIFAAAQCRKRFVCLAY